MHSNPSLHTKQLILIRHAKAVEEGVGGDHARPLSERGRADAAALADWLRARSLTADLALCSTAARTRQTLMALGAQLPTILADKLYLASPGEMLAQIQATDDAVTSLMLVGHNPGTHALAASLVGECTNEADADRLLLKFPTSACAVMTFNVTRWRDVRPQAGRLTVLR